MIEPGPVLLGEGRFQAPPVMAWIKQAEAYAEALGHRLPGVRIELRHPDAPAEPLAEVRALLVWTLPEGALSSLPDLEWVQVAGAGVDHLLDRGDLGADVLVTRSLGRFGAQVAEYVVGYLLSHLLDIEGHRERQRQRLWDRRPERPLLGDRTVGILGLGSLGRAIAVRISAFGATVLGTRRSAGDVPHVDKVYTAGDWRRMLPRCDVLIVAAPHTSETARMVDAEVIAALRPGSVLVNIARGALIDEAAALEALHSRQLAAVILDVFQQEPLPAEHPLWTERGAWITPHISAPSEVDSIADEFATNYRRFVAGEPLINLVDRQRGY